MSDGTKLASAHVVGGVVKYTQAIRVGHHALTADEPASGGGADAGPAPFQLLLAALGACTSITLRMYADRKGWELGELHVDLEMHRDAAGVESITRHLHFGAALTDEQRARLLEIAAKTPVTKTVRAGTAITTEIVRV